MEYDTNDLKLINYIELLLLETPVTCGLMLWTSMKELVSLHIFTQLLPFLQFWILRKPIICHWPFLSIILKITCRYVPVSNVHHKFGVILRDIIRQWISCYWLSKRKWSSRPSGHTEDILGYNGGCMCDGSSRRRRVQGFNSVTGSTALIIFWGQLLSLWRDLAKDLDFRLNLSGAQS